MGDTQQLRRPYARKAKKDITGLVSGRLTVIEATNYSDHHRMMMWKCLCDCGQYIELPTSRISTGWTKSCGCLQRERSRGKVKNIVGQKFGRLTVLSLYPQPPGSATRWTCECECGTVCVKNGSSLKTGSSKSCGCIASEMSATRPGGSATKERKRAYTQEYLAKKSLRVPPWVDNQKINEFYANCPEGFHVDHIIPLRGKLVSGLHVHYNLQYLPKRENILKGNRFEPQIITAQDDEGHFVRWTTN